MSTPQFSENSGLPSHFPQKKNIDWETLKTSAAVLTFLATFSAAIYMITGIPNDARKRSRKFAAHDAQMSILSSEISKVRRKQFQIQQSPKPFKSESANVTSVLKDYEIPLQSPPLKKQQEVSDKDMSALGTEKTTKRPDLSAVYKFEFQLQGMTGDQIDKVFSGPLAGTGFREGLVWLRSNSPDEALRVVKSVLEQGKKISPDQRKGYTGIFFSDLELIVHDLEMRKKQVR
ncbi:MAG: hypothetical protein P1V18_06305 [Candidatus Gracilibacteria bacterium]|nr:hypothetical protein [Candidatus Gracilibacteria bacterium]